MITAADLLLENEKLRSENQQQQLQIKKLQQQVEQLLRSIYGKKSEKFPVDPKQINLGLDLPEVKQEDQQRETVTYERKKPGSRENHKGRIPFPEHLPRVDVMLEPKEDVSGMSKIGEEITERLECEPGSLYVKRYIRPKYAKADNEGVVIADLPSSPIERGRAGASVLALVIIQKYVDHLPLYKLG